MRRFIPKGYQETMSNWKLGDTEISISTNATHVGILRSSEDELGKNVDERISCARRTLYSMTYTGLHGSNGLTPAVCSKIYQTYESYRVYLSEPQEVFATSYLVFDLLKQRFTSGN